MKNIFIIFLVFLGLHVLLLNINASEWGDSYRILRASEFIRDKTTYPEDEKRPPLFSFLLSIRPESIDQITWGRFFMLGLSVACFWVFYLVLKQLFPSANKLYELSLLMFALNPVILYWSLRIYADMLLLLIVLFSTWLICRWRKNFSFIHALFLGLIVGLSVLTRFEGYILFLSLGVWIIFLDGFEFKFFLILRSLKKHVLHLILYIKGVVLVASPYLYFRNPLTSSYLSEPSGRTYDINTVLIYLLSLLFVLGVIPAIFFGLKSIKYVWDFLINHIGIFVFIVFELLLILVWPAAIPRLFIQIIPFLIVLFCLSYLAVEHERPQLKLHEIGGLGLLLAGFVFGQFVYKLQFLIVLRPVYVLVVVLTLFSGVILYLQKYKSFLMVLLLTLAIWSIETIWIHKDIYKSISQASVYTLDNLKGRVGFNDNTGVADWYLNYQKNSDNVDGFALTETDYQRYAVEKNLDYLILTNETNPDLTFDFSKMPYLRKNKEFSYNIGSKRFVTYVAEVVKK